MNIKAQILTDFEKYIDIELIELINEKGDVIERVYVTNKTDYSLSVSYNLVIDEKDAIDIENYGRIVFIVGESKCPNLPPYAKYFKDFNNELPFDKEKQIYKIIDIKVIINK